MCSGGDANGGITKNNALTVPMYALNLSVYRFISSFVYHLYRYIHDHVELLEQSPFEF